MRKGSLVGLTAAALLWSVLPALAQGGGQPPVQLPEGNGRDIVQTACGKCHGLNMLTNSDGHTREGWQHLVSSMVVLPENQVGVVADYLAKSFPEKPSLHRAVIVPGPVNVSIREWVVPSLGSRPHDPLAAPDGSIWWSGQFASVLGRLDPKTGAMKEYPTKTPESNPHGLVADKAGNIWYTGIAKQHIGKLDPKTGTVTEYPLTDAKFRGPHTPIFDQKGILWFTIQSGGVGRLNPATGEMKMVAAPSSPAYPYGIQVNSKGIPWYVDFRGNRLGRVDPVTMEIKEYTLPNADARPRRIAITADDMLWYGDYARGYLGRLDPNTGAVKEWPSPGGRDSQPYGIATVGNIVWYSESNVHPNTLVRFDPQTERFQTWAIPSGGGVIRNMMATPEGNLVMACSAYARVALVEVRNSTSTR